MGWSGMIEGPTPYELPITVGATFPVLSRHSVPGSLGS
jgi:hypothetical protein